MVHVVTTFVTLHPDTFALFWLQRSPASMWGVQGINLLGSPRPDDPETG